MSSLRRTDEIAIPSGRVMEKAIHNKYSDLLDSSVRLSAKKCKAGLSFQSHHLQDGCVVPSVHLREIRTPLVCEALGPKQHPVLTEQTSRPEH